MRKVISVIIAAVLVAVYTGAWFYASHELQQNINESIIRLKTKGYSISYDSLKVGGFPFAIRAKLSNLKIIRPGYFKTWIDGEIKFTTTIFQPSRIKSVAIGEHHVEFSYKGQAISIQGQGFELLNTALDGSDAGIKYKKLLVNIAGEHAFQAENAYYQLRRLPDIEGIPAYDFKAEMQNLKSPYLNVKSLGTTLKSFKIDARLIGDMEGITLVERLQNWSKNGGTVEMAKVAVDWGDLHIDGNGTFTLDEAMQPAVAMAIKISGIEVLLKTMVAEKVINKNVAKAVKVGVDFFSMRDDEANNVINVTLQDGELSVGPITLMRIPKLQVE